MITPAQHQKIKDIIRLLIKGYTDEEIVLESSFGLPEKEVKLLIGDAKQLLRQRHLEPDIADQKAILLQKYQQIYEQALIEEKPQVALGAIKEIAQLQLPSSNVGDGKIIIEFLEEDGNV